MKPREKTETSGIDTSASVVQKLTDEFPHRETEIKILENSLSSQHIILYGPSGTGKTAVLRRLLELKNQQYIFIDCNECYTTRVFHLNLLCELFGRIEDQFKTIDTLNDCMNIFKTASDQKETLRFIVLKNFELLSAKIPALLAFQRTLLEKSWRFSFVFISEHWHHTLELSHMISRSPIVDFQNYTEGQFRDILLHLFSKKYDCHLLGNFLNIVLPLVTSVYVDIDDLIRITEDLFPVYKKPVDESKLGVDDVVPLSNIIMKRLKKINSDLIYVYSHFEDDENEKTSTDVELPLNTKYLLVAAYIASNVPAKDDQKLFCTQSKKKRRHQNIHQPVRITQTDPSLGPKSFPFNRLMAIYSVITGENLSMSANLIAQVATLVDLKLLISIGEGNLDTPTFKCIADSQLVHSVSKSVHFELQKYVPI